MGRRGRLSFISERLCFFTTSVVNHAGVFTEDRFCDILIENIKHHRKHRQFKTYGHVIVPSHFHWIVEVDPKLASSLMW